MQYLIEYTDYVKQIAEKKSVVESDPDLEYSEDDTSADYERKLAKRMKLRKEEMKDKEAVQKLVDFGPTTNPHMAFVKTDDTGGDN